MRIRRERGAMVIDLIVGGAICMMLLLAIGEISAELARGRLAHLQGSRLSAGAASLKVMFNAYGSTIAAGGSVPGFANALAPTENELRAAGFLPSFVQTQMPFGGVMTFAIQVGSHKDLLGLACGNTSILKVDIPDGKAAGQVMFAANGLGLRTSVGTPGLLNGPGFQNVASPYNGPAIVCAWAALPAQ